MFGMYSPGQSAPFVGQFIPTGTLDITNARRNIRGPPGHPSPSSYVSPRDVWRDYDVVPRILENTNSPHHDGNNNHTYSQYISSGSYSLSRGSRPGPSANDYEDYTLSDFESGCDDDEDPDYDYDYPASARQKRGYARPTHSSSASTAQRAPQATGPGTSHRCPYIDPRTGRQCSVYTRSGQEKRRHWTSCHEYGELKAMIVDRSLPRGRGFAIASVEQLANVRAQLACPTCDDLFSRRDARGRHMATFNH